MVDFTQSRQVSNVPNEVIDELTEATGIYVLPLAITCSLSLILSQAIAFHVTIATGLQVL